MTHLYLIIKSFSIYTSEEEEVQVHIASSSETEADNSSIEEDTEEEEDMYLTVSEDEDNSSDTRLELIDKQFNLKMKELFSRSSSGQLMPYTVEASLQNTADEMIKHLARNLHLKKMNFPSGYPSCKITLMCW